MKHTDYYNTFESIRQHIVEEIKTAVIAHGGSFDWIQNEVDAPIVAANPDTSEPEPLDIIINNVSLDEDGDLVIDAVDKEYGEDIDIDVDDIFVEHLGYIIDYMSDTESVSDVSIPVES